MHDKASSFILYMYIDIIWNMLWFRECIYSEELADFGTKFETDVFILNFVRNKLIFYCLCINIMLYMYVSICMLCTVTEGCLNYKFQF